MVADGTLDEGFKRLTTKETGSTGFDRDTHSLEAIGDGVAALGAVSGPGFNLYSVPSPGGNAERGARKTFYLVLYDRTTGKLVPVIDIDITGITALILKSTGGGSMSGGGLTAISFSKVLGAIKVEYLFLDAEWADDGGDAYEVRVSGVKATVGGVAVDVPEFTWSGAVAESGEAKSVLDQLVLDAASGFSTIDGKIVIIDNLIDKQDARPLSLTTATITDQDLTTEKEITIGTQHIAARGEVVKLQFTLKDLVSALANYTFRTTVLRGGVLYSLGTSVIQNEVGSTAFMREAEQTLESGDVVRSFVTSDNAGDNITPDATMEVFEVQ